MIARLPRIAVVNVPHYDQLREKRPAFPQVYMPPQPNRTERFFAIVFTQRDDHDVFDIQNNAGFVLSKGEPIGVSFVTPPLGGTWTQEHLGRVAQR